MRKALVLALVGSLALAGVAVAAVTNNYVVFGKVTPVKSGTVKHPMPIAAQIGWTVSTSPSGQRPNVVKTYNIFSQGIRASTNDFPACSSSTLTASGPSKCARGSQIGKGYFIVEAGPSSSQSAGNVTCRAETLLFNGGGNANKGEGTFILYVYKGAQVTGQPAPCPIPNNHQAVAILLSNSTSGLHETFTTPFILRHPYNGVDAATVKSFVSLPAKSRTFSTRVNGHSVKKTVGLLETYSCPPNHQRQATIKFITESGTQTLSTGLTRCTK